MPTLKLSSSSPHDLSLSILHASFPLLACGFVTLGVSVVFTYQSRYKCLLMLLYNMKKRILSYTMLHGATPILGVTCVDCHLRGSRGPRSFLHKLNMIPEHITSSRFVRKVSSIVILFRIFQRAQVKPANRNKLSQLVRQPTPLHVAPRDGKITSTKYLLETTPNVLCHRTSKENMVSCFYFTTQATMDIPFSCFLRLQVVSILLLDNCQRKTLIFKGSLVVQILPHRPPP